MIIDSHCHLADDAFAADRAEVVARAQAAGVTAALCILAADDTAEQARALAEVRPLWAAVSFATAVHPHRAGAYEGEPSGAAAKTREAARTVGAVALGEMGLDYHYDFAPRAIQQAVFAAQLELAAELDLPVVVHTREAFDDTLAMIQETGLGRTRGVMHCFTGSADEARRALEVGFWISFSGILTFPRAEDLRQVAALVPLDRLLVETDAPYLAPVPNRGRRNEPAWVVETLQCLAGIHGRSTDSTAERLEASFAEFLGRSEHLHRAVDPRRRVET